jgi:hypothetical protein
MALKDIVFNNGESQKFLLEIPIGTLNEPQDIVFNISVSAIMEIGPSYVDPEVIAAIVWAYDNRTLTN